MWKIFRSFTKYASIQELGKIPSEVNKYLKLLGDLNLYKSMRGDKAVQTLDLFYKASKKKINILNPNWSTYPEIQVMLSELPQKLKNYSLKNIFSLMKTCTKLGITDSSLWASIELAVIENLYQLEERQLYDLVSCFSKRKNTKTVFWEQLEAMITENFCPKHNLQGHVVSMILTNYSKLNLLNPKFLAVLEQQVLRVYLSLDGVELSKVLNIYVQHGGGTEELYTKLCKQVKIMVYNMDWYSSTAALVSFVRIGRADHVEEIEKCVKLWLDRLEFQHFSSIFFAYGKNLPVLVRKDTDRRKFLQELAEFLQGKESFGEVEVRAAVNLMWGMGVARMFQYEKLWRRLAKVVKNKKECNEIKEYEKLEHILKENGKIELLE